MKGRRWITLVMFLASVVFSACSSSENSGETVSEVMQAEANEAKELVIYFSNSKADGLETETILVEEVTPDIIVGYLAVHNIVSMDTKVNEFQITEEDGKSVLHLDLSEAFGEYLETMGSGGENVIMTALTDTFLQAYEADALQITVEGKTIETCHAIYDEPLTFGEVSLDLDFQ